MSRLSHPSGGPIRTGATRVCADDLAAVRQSIAARARRELTLVLDRVPTARSSSDAAAAAGAGDPGQEPARGGRGEPEGPTLSASSRGAARPQVPRVETKEAHAARRVLGECRRRTRPDTAPKTTAGPAEPTQGQGRESRAPPGPSPGAAKGAEKPARCPIVSPAAGGEGAHLRSPSGAEAGRAAAQRRAVPRGRRARLPSPRLPAAPAASAAASAAHPPLRRPRPPLLSPPPPPRGTARPAPRAWSHAPPAPRALGPAPRPRPASPLGRWAPPRGTRRPEFPPAPSRRGAHRPAPLPGEPRHCALGPGKGVGLVTARGRPEAR